MGDRIRIYFNYRHVDTPWGGANSFIRALSRHLAGDPRFELVDRPEASCVLFLSQFSEGPARDNRKTPLSEIRAWKAGGKILVVRAVNLHSNSSGFSIRRFFEYRASDRESVELMNLADRVIYQSEFQRSFFESAGVANPRFTVIHNGADPAVFSPGVRPPELDGLLRLVSLLNTPRLTKRQDLIARISERPGIEVRHVGNWPEGAPRGEIQFLGVLDHAAIVPILRESHFFLHPAEKDPCPNVLFEAISCGLPVLYLPGRGSSEEIIQENGLPIDPEQLDRSLADAREAYPRLIQKIHAARPYYLIARAAMQYSEVFAQAASSGELRSRPSAAPRQSV
jgi:glycosyltransferase involved in cell wall biosynthesis